MKIAIIGLKPDQEQRIAKEFAYHDFSFVSSTSGGKRPNVPDADTVMLMTKFVSHEQQAAVRNHGGLQFVNGGLSSLRELLRSL